MQNFVSFLYILVWVFDIPPLYDNCDLGEETCEAIGAQKLHEFNHSVYASDSIIATCGEGESVDGLADWIWYAEGHKFHESPIPR